MPYERKTSMPKRAYKKAAPKKYVKKTYGRKPSDRNLTSGLGGGNTSLVKEPWQPLFSASVKKRLRYSTTFTGSCTSGAITSTQVFRANDLYDPDFTSTGHQPMGFDQMMTFFNHFTVVWAKITCVFRCTSGTSPTVCLRVDADSTPLTVIDRIVEIGGCSTQNLEQKYQYGCSKALSMIANIPKIQGVSESSITSDSTLRGNAASSPSEVTYFHITCWDTSGFTGSFACDIILDQIAVFTEPRNIIES